MALPGYLKSDQKHSQVCAGPLLKKVEVPLCLSGDAQILCSGNTSHHLAGQEYPDTRNPSACQKQSAGFKAQMAFFFFYFSF